MTTHDELLSTSPSISPEAWGLDALISIAELSAYLGVPVATIYDWRVHGHGPAAFRFGKHLRFAISDVRAWIAEQKEPAGQTGTAHRR